MKNKIFIISGPSGVGKKTIIDQFINEPDLNLSYSISMTTRQKREGEINNKDYYFVSNSEFEQAIKDNEMVEWAEFCNNKYGTRKSELKRILEIENKNVLLEIEIQGALQVFKNLDHNEYISIFIIPPTLQVLESRLLKRNTEKYEQIKKRIEVAKTELEYTKYYDYVVVNDNIQDCKNEIIKIIKDACKK